MEEIINILPIDLQNKLKEHKNIKDITEIRIRVNKKVSIYFGTREITIDYVVDSSDILLILKNVSMGSIYSIQNELNKGYITIFGGHRIGVAGKVVVVDNVIKNIKEIMSLNIRIAHEIIGASKDIMPYILKNGEILNTLIVSKPYMGKTSILRDIIRNLSNSGYNTCVIDERGEIASIYNNETKLDLGIRTDVISNIDKAYGIHMAIRSLNPQVICTDEIGDEEDLKAIKDLSRSGVKFIVTMHGNSYQDVENSNMNELIKKGYIDNIIILGDMPGNIKKVYENVSKKEKVYVSS